MKDFLVYIPAAYPNMDTTKKILLELCKLPISGVEVGVPFSDPVADGPVIQKAHVHALKNNTNLKEIIEMIYSLNLSKDIFLMGYLNPFMAYGQNLESDLKKASIKGLIIPDLPLSEIENVDINYPLVVFAAPNTTEADLPKINKQKAPFVYYIPRYGVTGVKDDLPYLDDLLKLKKDIKSKIYMGFGISNKDQVKKVWEYSDGVIVGSAIVQLMESGTDDEIVKKVVNKVKSLL